MTALEESIEDMTPASGGGGGDTAPNPNTGKLKKLSREIKAL